MAPTATEVIEAGAYLEPDFNPQSLTVPILLSILTYHKIPYPTELKKQRLVQVFLEEIRPRSKEFKKEKLRSARQKPSNDGFTNGLTGSPVAEASGPSVRRSSRRTSATPDPAPPVTDPGKRRRAGVGEIRKAIVRQPAVAEDSEPEEVPQRRTVAQRTHEIAATAGSQLRQGDDDIYSDNNVFQSGPDSSSSPARPIPDRSAPKHKSTAKANIAPIPALSVLGGRRSVPRDERSYSAGPVVVPVASAYEEEEEEEAAEEEEEVVEEVEQEEAEQEDEEQEEVEDEEESTGRGITPEYDHLVPVSFGDSDSEVEENGEADQGEDVKEEAEEEDDSVVEVDPRTVAISRKIAKIGSRDASAVATQPPRPIRPFFSLQNNLWRFVFTVGTLAALASVFEFKRTSSWVGYCDAGTNTNLRIIELDATRQYRLTAASECRYEWSDSISQAKYFSGPVCSPLPLKNPYDATTCTPCPKNATCVPDAVVCNPSFVLEPQLVTKIPFVASIMNGIPGMGSVAFPPKCVPDLEQAKFMEGLGRGIEDWLSKTRGDRICAGVRVPHEDVNQEAMALGFTHEMLRSAAHARRKKANRSNEDTDEVFEKIITKLEKAGLIITGTDTSGEVYHAATRVQMNMKCSINVALRETWETWRNTLYAMISLFFALLYGRHRSAANAIEARKVAELVQLALDYLQEQEMAYYTDQVSTPEDFIVPARLRDLVLQEEHSPKVRQKIWEKVRPVIEGNANVRTNLQEVHGEDTTVWKWVGSPSAVREKRRLSMAAGRGD